MKHQLTLHLSVIHTASLICSFPDLSLPDCSLNKLPSLKWMEDSSFLQQRLTWSERGLGVAVRGLFLCQWSWAVFPCFKAYINIHLILNVCLYAKNSEIHSYYSSKDDHLHLPFYRTNHGQCHLRYHGGKICYSKKTC